MAKIEKKAPYQLEGIEIIADPEVDGGFIASLYGGTETFTGSVENLYQLAAGEAGDRNEYLLYQIGSRMHGDGVTPEDGFAALKACIERAPFEMLT